MASTSAEDDVSSIDPRMHLFFDDNAIYVRDVRDAVNAEGLPLVAIECPPGEVELYDEKDGKVKISPDRFSRVKSSGFKDRQFKDFLIDMHKETEIGNGITIQMIQQIIDFEDTPGNSKERMYFFDFDMLLSQVKSVSFAFGDRKIDGNISRLIPAYARYIFSDHIGAEPSTGRLRLLRIMFEKIGQQRVYVITSNNLANELILNKKTGALAPNPFKQYFLELIRELLPSFNESHFICTFSGNTAPLFNNKGAAVVHILTHRLSPKRNPTSKRASGKGNLSKGGFKTRSFRRNKKRKTTYRSRCHLRPK